MRAASSDTIARLATTIAVVALLGLICIVLFDLIGAPFGTLNDICVGLGGALSGGLAWTLYPSSRASAPRLSPLALGANWAGAGICVVGSGLVIFGVTGWFLAAQVTTFGYALIGLWLVVTNRSAARMGEWSMRLARFGMTAGGVASIGLLAGPGIIARTDDMASAPWWVSGSIYLGGLGWNVLYTAWCLWLNRQMQSSVADPPVGSGG